MLSSCFFLFLIDKICVCYLIASGGDFLDRILNIPCNSNCLENFRRNSISFELEMRNLNRGLPKSRCLCSIEYADQIIGSREIHIYDTSVWWSSSLFVLYDVINDILKAL